MGGALIPIRWDGYKNLAKTIEEYSVRADMQPIPIMVMNGFCFMFKRQLIKEIGLFDHVNFPSGYGEVAAGDACFMLNDLLVLLLLLLLLLL